MLFGKPRKRGARDAWQAAAESFGLLHQVSGFWSGPKLTGIVSGNELTVDMLNRNTASAETRFRLGIPALNLGLKLKKKGFWNSLGPRVLTGDRAFDNQVVINTLNESAVRQFLTPQRRTEIQSFLSGFKSAVITDNEISFKTRGYVKKADEMQGAIDVLMELARVLAEEPDSTPVEDRNIGPAAVIAPSDIQEAAAPEQQPADFDELEIDPASEPEPLSVDAAASDIVEAPELEVEEFCANVFAPGVLSFAANQKFKESYEGERIAWTGTLESMTPFTFDFDFGSGRGTKAVLTIFEGEAVGSRSVQAVLGLPPGIEGLSDKIGQPVAFTGRLLKVDGLAKRIVIADAELKS